MQEIEKINNTLEIELFSDSKSKQELDFYTKMSLGTIANYGVSLEPLMKNIFAEGSQSGVYRVIIPKGQVLSKTKFGKLIGTTLRKGGDHKFAGQAELIPLNFDPARLALAVALSQIENKLEEIKEIQRNILSFLIEKEKSILRGNLITLIDVQNNFKYNWNNDTYKINKHIQVQDIKKESEQTIIFYKNNIQNILANEKKFVRNKDVYKIIASLDDLFEEYQLSLYLYSFSTYLEVMLLSLDNPDFIKKSYEKIRDYSFVYRELYSKSYTLLEQLNDKAFEKHIYKGFSSVNEFAAKAIEKLPLKSKEKKNGGKFNKFITKNLVTQTSDLLIEFTKNSNSNIVPFINQLKSLGNIQESGFSIMFDKDNVYIEKSSL